MKKLLLCVAAATLLATGAAGWAQEADDDDDAAPAAAAAPAFGARTLEIGAAGLMERSNRTDLDPIQLTAGALNSAGTYKLLSGGYYRIKVVSDGTQEQAIEAPGLFRNVWVNEVVINDLEVRPLGLDSIEFDDEGEVEISFIAITPGTYDLRIRGTSGDTQKATFTIE
jgi:hypothetical protein